MIFIVFIFSIGSFGLTNHLGEKQKYAHAACGFE